MLLLDIFTIILNNDNYLNRLKIIYYFLIIIKLIFI